MDFHEFGKKSANSGRKVVASLRSRSNPIEYFWLCDACATVMTVQLSEAGEVRLVSSARPPESVPAPPKRAERGLIA
jgi:hypothetical protein